MQRKDRHRPWAWRYLLNLDGAALARRELVQAGISARRIEALYPQAFSNFLPGLKRHIDSQGADHLYLRSDAAALERDLSKVQDRLWFEHQVQYMTDAEAEPAIGELQEHLEQIWRECHRSSRPENALNHALFLWSGWWFMVNYHRLHEGIQRAADDLLFALDGAWEFPRVGGGDE